MDQTLDFNFNNPTKVSDAEFADILSLEFADPTEGEGNKPDPKPEPKPTPPTNTNSNPLVTEEEETEEGVEFEEETQEDSNVINYESVINNLADKGFIKEAYEGFNEEEEITEDTLIKLLTHNLDKEKEGEFDNFISSLTPLTQRLLEFDANSDPKQKNKEVESYLKTLIEENSIKALDPENEYDQEKIVKQWYKSKEGYTPVEIEEKVQELKEAGLLQKESKRIKPKLDEEAEAIARKQEEDQRNLNVMKQKFDEQYNNKLINVLKTGKVGGINLSKEEATNLYSYMTADEVPVNIGGKVTTMSHLEALLFFNKHHENGSIENLALATLLLTNPEKFEKEYSRKMETKVTEEFVKTHKYNNKIKTGEAKETKKNAPEPRWRFAV
jgi:hypothetical protein